MPKTLGTAELSDCIDAAGYPFGTAVGVGVSGPFGDDLIKTAGFIPNELAFEPDTMVYTGSLAKQVTAACVAMLVQSGQLDTNVAITHWLTELPEWAQRIEVHHLIHHTAGLPGEAMVWTEMQRFPTRDLTSVGIVDALARMTSYRANPGVAYNYSNSGYVCLALIVERISGQRLPAFADEHIFRPLGMVNTCFWSGPEPRPKRGVALERTLAPAPLSLGDGGLWSTLHDLLRWNDSLNQKQLPIADMLHKVGCLDDGTTLDYAWGTRVFTERGFKVQSHGGSWAGSTAKLIRIPDHKLSIVALALHDDVERIVALMASVLEAFDMA